MFDTLRTLPSRVVILLAASALTALAALAVGTADIPAPTGSALVVVHSGTGWQ
ncbi:hypothetical protein [Streptosporangium saharense]|uniref:hypothetical protein n=1 Tax=Streptosporangium saharense TaxID=1706840 RepID=UPI00344948F0